MNQTIHKLLITPKFAKTLCGQSIIAYYPMSHTAMLEDAGAEPIKVSLDKGVTCPECRKKMKDV